MPTSESNHPTRSAFDRTALITAAGLAFSLADSDAGSRRFAYSYEVTTAPQGLLELENWVTWKHSDDRDRFEFRHEIEYGLTDKLQIALYLADWRYDDFSDDREDKAEYRNSAIEVIYNLSDPVNDLLGSALYGEVQLGPEKVELEGKILLQKNFGPFAAVYNFTLEAEWEGEDLDNLDERKGVIENSVGLNYQFSPKFFVGVEALHEFEIEDWETRGDDAVYVGPNVSFRTGNFFATAAALFQATDLESEPDSQVRLIVGFDF